MTGAAVLEAFAAVGVQLREDAGQVTYRAPFGKVPPALRDALRDHEAEVLALLSGLAPAAPAGISKQQPDPLAQPLVAALPAPFVRPPGTCYCCGGTEFWRSRWVEWICRVCHPPAPGAEVAA